jgi:hypothetical protein
MTDIDLWITCTERHKFHIQCKLEMTGSAPSERPCASNLGCRSSEATTMRFPGRGAQMIACTPGACRVVPNRETVGGIQNQYRIPIELRGACQEIARGRQMPAARSERRGASFGRRAGATRAVPAGVGVNSRGLIACLHAPRPGNRIVTALRSIRIRGKSHELEFGSKWPFRLAIQLHIQIVKLGSGNFTGKSFASAGKQLI